MSEKCVYGVVIDTCSAKSIKENKRYLYRALNAPIEIVEKGSLKIGEHFQLENRIYEVINKKDSYQTYEVINKKDSYQTYLVKAYRETQQWQAKRWLERSVERRLDGP